MKRNIKVFGILISIFTVIIIATISHYEDKIKQLNNNHNIAIAQLEEAHKEEMLQFRTYEYLYNENKKDLDKVRIEYKALKTDYENFKNNIAYVKSQHIYSRGVSNDLTKFEPITVDELNEWISQKAPKDSPFIGKAETFIKASKETGLDPKYIVAHAALESGWGTSSISKSKNNFFGIGAYNSSPTKSAYSFKSMQDGIISGAKWIADNYINKGQNTLEKMIFGTKAYCQTDSGKPDSKWIYKVFNIMN